MSWNQQRTGEALTRFTRSPYENLVEWYYIYAMLQYSDPRSPANDLQVMMQAALYIS